MALDAAQRRCVEGAVRQVCIHREWDLLAINVRTNHVHVVVGGEETPERMMGAFKAWSTRALRNAQLIGDDVRTWSRHGSTRYLWNEQQIHGATTYVLFGQEK